MYTVLSIAFAALAQMNARYGGLRSIFDQELLVEFLIGESKTNAGAGEAPAEIKPGSR